MNIKIDDYVITSDPLQYILNERRVKGVKSRTPGEVALHPIGYYTSLHGLLTALFDKKLRKSTAGTIKDLKVDILEATELVRRAVALVNEATDE